MDHFDRCGWLHWSLAFHAEYGSHPLAQRARTLCRWIVLASQPPEPRISEGKTYSGVATSARPSEVRGIGVFLVTINVMDFYVSSIPAEGTDSRFARATT